MRRGNLRLGVVAADVAVAEVVGENDDDVRRRRVLRRRVGEQETERENAEQFMVGPRYGFATGALSFSMR